MSEEWEKIIIDLIKSSENDLLNMDDLIELIDYRYKIRFTEKEIINTLIEIIKKDVNCQNDE